MQKDIVKKFGSDKVKDFWVFVSNLAFDSKSQEVATVRTGIMKRLAPNVANTYKDIADELAFSLYRSIYYDKKNTFLYASFEAISKGESFYNNCWDNPLIIAPIVESLDQFNNFSNVLPTEDDYYSSIIPSPESIVEDYDDYDYNETLNGNEKGSKKTGVN